MRPAITLLSASLVLVLGGAAAHAGGNSGVVVTGEATMQAPLAAQLEGWLKAHNRDVVASPLEPDAINTLVDCFVIEDQTCATGVVEKRAKVETVVFARIDVTAATDGTRDVTLTGYWFSKGHKSVTERRFCERCNEDSLRHTADALMVALSGAGAPDTGHLKLVSKPSGAHVLIDDHSAGATPLEFDLSPGSHKITITADDHQVEIRAVAIEQGKTEAVTVELLPGHGRHDMTIEDDQPAPRSHLVPGLAIGIGGAAVIAGGVMIAVGGPPDKSGPQPKTYSNYRTPGIGIAIGGAVAIGVGTYLWTRHYESSSAPTVAVSHDGGFVGWAGSF